MGKAEQGNGPPPVRPDELSGEVAIRAHVDHTGLTVAGKSRFVAATDRLLGAAVGIPAAWLEGIRKRTELDNEAREKLVRAEGERAIELVQGLDDFGKATAQRMIAEESRKQLNREAVWHETRKALQSLPPPTSSEDKGESRELDEDWMNLFADYAEKATTERFRKLWGRILAGEIRLPGSFALSTLRIISEMDAKIATAFQEVVALRFGEHGEFILRPVDFRDETLLKWIFLEEVGLLQAVNGNLHINHLRTLGEADEKIIRTKEYFLKISLSERAPHVRIPFVGVTRAGQEIAQILPWNETEALKGLAAQIDQNLRLELGRIVTPINEAQFHGEIIEIIKTPSGSD